MNEEIILLKSTSRVVLKVLWNFIFHHFSSVDIKVKLAHLVEGLLIPIRFPDSTGGSMVYLIGYLVLNLDREFTTKNNLQ